MGAQREGLVDSRELVFGQVKISSSRIFEFPPGARDGERFEVNLGPAGIRNLMMEVRIFFH